MVQRALRGRAARSEAAHRAEDQRRQKSWLAAAQERSALVVQSVLRGRTARSEAAAHRAQDQQDVRRWQQNAAQERSARVLQSAVRGRVARSEAEGRQVEARQALTKEQTARVARAAAEESRDSARAAKQKMGEQGLGEERARREEEDWLARQHERMEEAATRVQRILRGQRGRCHTRKREVGYACPVVLECNPIPIRWNGMGWGGVGRMGREGCGWIGPGMGWVDGVGYSNRAPDTEPDTHTYSLYTMPPPLSSCRD